MHVILMAVVLLVSGFSTLKFPPKVVPDFNSKMDDVAKIIGVSDDLEAVARCEAAVREQFAATVRAKQSSSQREPAPRVSAARSQPYYLDKTYPEANKGAMVMTLSTMLAIPSEQIATFGDMPNDMSMFAKSGICIAMGQSSDKVKKAATYVTTSSEEEGFANGMEQYILTNA